MVYLDLLYVSLLMRKQRVMCGPAADRLGCRLRWPHSTTVNKPTQCVHLKLTITILGLVWCFFGSEGHVALDRNPGPGYDTLLLRIIPGDLLSAFPHRQFHTLPGLLDSWAALPNSNPNACMPMQGGSLYHFYDGLWYDPVERRTHDLPCERRTRYRLSNPTRHIRLKDKYPNFGVGLKCIIM